jgi:ribosomal protein S18 acetylase RimI-like enzyme
MESLEQGLQTGWLSTYVREVRPGVDAWFLADRPAGRGLRIHALQLTESHPEAVATLVDALDRSESGPVYAISDLLQEISIEDQRKLFESRGFSYRALVEMESEGRVPFEKSPNDFDFRLFVPQDRDAFVSLYSRVYSEPEGDYWLFHSPDVGTDASVFLDQFISETDTWANRFVAEASLVREIAGRMIGNVIVERSSSGVIHVSGLMVDPDYQRQGIGRALLRCALNRLGGSGSERVTLVVIRDSAAYRLYRAEGFREVPPPQGLRPSYWVRSKTG